jgi:AraC-like DNA-binding protein
VEVASLIVIQDVLKHDLGHSILIMPKLSIPILLCLVLIFIAGRVALRARGNPSARMFLILMMAASLQSLFVSLRWDFGITSFRVAQIALSCILPALAWVSFSVLGNPAPLSSPRQGRHVLPAVLALVAIWIAPELVDIIIIATFLGYGVAFLRLLRSGSDGLTNIVFDGALNVRRALLLVVFMLFGSALIDFLVFLDFATAAGAHAVWFIAVGNLAWLIVIGISALLTTDALPDEEDPGEAATPPDQRPDEEDVQTEKLVSETLRSGQLYKDANLTLTRLARRCGVPARQVSRAINRSHNCNVSQYVNAMRITEACRLLKETDMPITSVIYESGFQTKSNFNREFLRITGKIPRDWRDKLRQTPWQERM